MIFPPAEQVEHMTKVYHIYMLRNGRINMCGLTSNNIDHVADAIHDAVLKVPAADGSPRVNGRL